MGWFLVSAPLRGRALFHFLFLCHVIFLSLMLFVWDGVGGVGGVGDGNVRCYVILLSGMGWVGWGMVTFVVTSSCCP